MAVPSIVQGQGHGHATLDGHAIEIAAVREDERLSVRGDRGVAIPVGTDRGLGRKNRSNEGAHEYTE